MNIKSEKNGYWFFLYPFFLWLSLYSADLPAESLLSGQLVQPASAADKIVDFSVLEFATPELSVRLIDQYQPELNSDADSWFKWEQKRLQLLAGLGQWAETVERINSYLQQLPETLQPYFRLSKASSQLKIGQFQSVANDMRQLLWSQPELSTEQIAMARRLIVHSYLAEKKVSDAQRAMLRYRQDYGESGVQWKRLQAKVLIATERYQEAADLLANEKDPSLEVVKKLTRFYAGQDAANTVLVHAQKTLSNKKLKLDDSIRRQYWMLISIVADRNGDAPVRIEALEQVLMTGSADADQDLITVSADTLWQAYLDYARVLANQQHLLVGDDTSWYQLASNSVEKQSLRARVLFAYLGHYATEKTQKLVSLEQLAEIINKNFSNGLQLVRQLFMFPGEYAIADGIPDKVRYLLLDDALAKGQIKQAALHFSFLSEPPEGQKRLGWSLRRARVMVLGGQYQKATDVLLDVLEAETLDKAMLNRLMQVVFDLQKVEQHPLALIIFDRLLLKNNSADFKRELEFWKAESFQAMKQYEKSAQHYLISAMMIADKQADPWSQTAHYRAANVLTQAGLLNDARAIYRLLLRTTKDPNRKAVIKQKLQHIWLLEGKQNGDIE